MAQLQREGSAVARHVRGLLRRGRGACIAAALVVLAVIAALWLGVAGAAGTSFTIERGAGSTELFGAGEREAGSSDASDERAEGDGGATGVPGAEAEAPAMVVVDVGGAVTRPGVVELEAGDRVADAIAAAGGLAVDADCTTLNQAQVLQDGQKVYVPHEGEAVPAASDGGVAETGTGAAGALVNINTASVEELDALPGVGPATAQAIVDDRAENGPFTAPEDIMRVSGIGEKKYENLEALICV